LEDIKKVPIVLMAGNKDKLAPPSSVEWLKQRIPKNCLEKVYFSDRDHGELTFNVEGAYLEELVSQLNKFNPAPKKKVESLR
jgi:pimeloyl-ACP methyl ester carboxylesterase